MDFPDAALTVVKEVLGIPFYYSKAEQELSSGVTVVLALLGFGLAIAFAPRTGLKVVVGGAALLFALFVHYRLTETAGIFSVQLFVRAVASAAFGYFVGTVFMSDEKTSKP